MRDAQLAAIRFGFRALSSIAPGLAAHAGERLWFTPPRPRIRDEQRAFLGTGQRFELAVNGRPVAAWRWGAGPTVVLMHGWGGFGAQMQHFVPPLVDAGFQAVAFDAPAHGESGPSRLGARRSTLLDFADVLIAMRQEAPEIAGVVAHSGGGTAAAWALRASPDLRLRRLALISPMGSVHRYQDAFQRMVGLSDAAMRRFYENTERMLGFRWTDWEVPAMANGIATPPVLVVHDRDDRETAHEDGASIAAAWPNAVLRTTTGLGHYRILRDPGVVSEVVQFVRAGREQG
ncbi:MAG: alpha/beta fold hydrolase [Gemmatimonadaceae bacterium]